MNQFGYNCPWCEGSTKRCGTFHNYCVRCVDCKFCGSSTCRCMECRITGHIQSACSGSFTCYEKTVFCVINEEYAGSSDIGDNFYGTYDGYGKVVPDILSKKKFINEDNYISGYIPIKIICKSCYLEMTEYYKDLNNKYSTLQEELNNLDDDEKSQFELFKKDYFSKK